MRFDRQQINGALGWLAALEDASRKPDGELSPLPLPQTRETLYTLLLTGTAAAGSGSATAVSAPQGTKDRENVSSVRADSAGAPGPGGAGRIFERSRAHCMRKLAGDCRRACGKIWDFRGVADAASTLWRRRERAGSNGTNWMKIARVYRWWLYT